MRIPFVHLCGRTPLMSTLSPHAALMRALSWRVCAAYSLCLTMCCSWSPTVPLSCPAPSTALPRRRCALCLLCPAEVRRSRWGNAHLAHRRKRSPRCEYTGQPHRERGQTKGAGTQERKAVKKPPLTYEWASAYWCVFQAIEENLFDILPRDPLAPGEDTRAHARTGERRLHSTADEKSAAAVSVRGRRLVHAARCAFRAKSHHQKPVADVSICQETQRSTKRRSARIIVCVLSTLAHLHVAFLCCLVLFCVCFSGGYQWM